MALLLKMFISTWEKEEIQKNLPQLWLFMPMRLANSQTTSSQIHKRVQGLDGRWGFFFSVAALVFLVNEYSRSIQMSAETFDPNYQKNCESWIPGSWTLRQVVWNSTQELEFQRSCRSSCYGRPGNPTLRASGLSLLSHILDWKSKTIMKDRLRHGTEKLQDLVVRIQSQPCRHEHHFTMLTSASYDPSNKEGGDTCCSPLDFSEQILPIWAKAGVETGSLGSGRRVPMLAPHMGEKCFYNKEDQKVCLHKLRSKELFSSQVLWHPCEIGICNPALSHK